MEKSAHPGPRFPKEHVTEEDQMKRHVTKEEQMKRHVTKEGQMKGHAEPLKCAVIPSRPQCLVGVKYRHELIA